MSLVVKSTQEFQAKLSWNGICCQLYPLFSEYYLSVLSVLTCWSKVMCCIIWLSFSRVFWSSVNCLAANQKKFFKKTAAGTLTLQECLLHASVHVKLSARRASVPRAPLPTTPGNISSNLWNYSFVKNKQTKKKQATTPDDIHVSSFLSIWTQLLNNPAWHPSWSSINLWTAAPAPLSSFIPLS